MSELLGMCGELYCAIQDGLDVGTLARARLKCNLAAYGGCAQYLQCNGECSACSYSVVEALWAVLQSK